MGSERERVEERLKIVGLGLREVTRRGGPGHDTLSRFLSGRSAGLDAASWDAMAMVLDTTASELRGEETALIRHARLHPVPHLQPRKAPRSEAVMAQQRDSIARDGIMQNLLVRPATDMPAGNYYIVAGWGRWLRMGELIADGRWPRDRGLPCQVRLDLDDAGHRRLALAENLERDDLHPADLAESVRAMVDMDGKSTAAVATELGGNYTQRWVQITCQIVRHLSGTDGGRGMDIWRAGGMTREMGLLLAQSDYVLAKPALDKVVNAWNAGTAMTEADLRRTITLLAAGHRQLIQQADKVLVPAAVAKTGAADAITQGGAALVRFMAADAETPPDLTDILGELDTAIAGARRYASVRIPIAKALRDLVQQKLRNP